jgi:hypothetical protein
VIRKIVSKSEFVDVIPVFLEQGKVQMTFGDLYKQINEVDEAKDLYKKAVITF